MGQGCFFLYIYYEHFGFYLEFLASFNLSLMEHLVGFLFTIVTHWRISFSLVNRV